ncbi:AtpZ/AtpI family protein [Candidatus Falkowbacteria bacterium]|nr:AtpZ/AtpI family protein [Candidatus Falkowbacteria bacterium]
MPQEEKKNPPRPPFKKWVNKEAWWQPALLMFARLSGWIIAPVLIGTFLGRWLDKKHETGPWLFLASVGAAFIISIIGLVKNVAEEYGKIDKNGKDKK